MKKQVYTLGMIAFLGLGVLANAQVREGAVGINVGETPKATLDVQPTTANLKGTTNEGIIAPKLTKERVAKIATPVEGTLVYVTDTTYSGNKTEVAKIDDKGYYYFDGTVWVKARGAAAQAVGANNGLTKIGDNIELGGTLTKATNINQAGNNFTITKGNVGINIEDPQNQLSVNGVSGSGSFFPNNVARAIYTGITGGAGTIGQYMGFGVYKKQYDNNNFLSVADREESLKQRFVIWNAFYEGGSRVFFSPFVPEKGNEEQEFNVADNSALTILHNNKNIGIGTNYPTAKLEVNGDVKIKSMADGNPDTDYVVLADTEGNIKRAAAGSLGKSYEGSTSVILKGNSFERAALTGDVTSAQNSNEVIVNAIQGKSISNTAPTDGQVLKWNETNSKWEPSTDTDSGAMLTANNGLTKTGDNIELGGTLTKVTNINQAGNNFTITKGYVGINVEDPQNQLSVNGVSGSGNFFTNNAARAIYTGVTGGAGTIGQYIGFGVYKKQYDDNNFLSVADREEALKQRFVIWNAFYEGGSRVFFSPFTPEKGNEEQEFNVAGNSALTILQKNKNIGIGTNDPTAKLDINGNVKIRSIAIGNPDTDYVVLADTYGNIKKANVTNFKGPKGDTGDTGAQGPAGAVGPKGDKGEQGDSGVAKGINGITYNEKDKSVALGGDLTKATTINQNNNNLTFTTGETGRFVVNGTSKLAGAQYVNIRTVTVADFALEANDYMINYKGGGGTITLPAASESTGRVVCFYNYGSGEGEALTTKAKGNAGAIQPGYGGCIISDGTEWITKNAY